MNPISQKKVDSLAQMKISKIEEREAKYEQYKETYGEDHGKTKFIALQLIKLQRQVAHLRGYSIT